MKIKPINQAKILKTSRIAKFVEFLIKSFVLPLDVKNEGGISFSHRRFVIHVFLFLIPFLFFDGIVIISTAVSAGEISEGYTNVEVVSSLSSFIVQFSMLFPFILRCCKHCLLLDVSKNSKLSS